MELSGNLSDFGLADILQILSLSRKTGTLALEAGPVTGKIVIEHGRITYAALKPGETLLGRLTRELEIDRAVITDLVRVSAADGGLWSVESLILESGLVGYDDLREVARRHFQDIVGNLVRVEKGTFGISLAQSDNLKHCEDIYLTEGLDIAEVLLGSAKDLDESRRRDKPAGEGSGSRAGRRVRIPERQPESDNAGAFIVPTPEGVLGTSVAGGSGGHKTLYELVSSGSAEGVIVEGGAEQGNRSNSNLVSVLSELRFQSYESEISLLVMRYASQVAARGVLLSAEGDEVRGLGQFGIERGQQGRGAEECVRALRFPIRESKLLQSVIKGARPFVGEVNGDAFCWRLLSEVGGSNSNLKMFLLPVYGDGNSKLLLYGDNFPGVVDFQGLDELLALIEQANLAVEKLLLERRIMLLEEAQRGG